VTDGGQLGGGGRGLLLSGCQRGLRREGGATRGLRLDGHALEGLLGLGDAALDGGHLSGGLAVRGAGVADAGSRVGGGRREKDAGEQAGGEGGAGCSAGRVGGVLQQVVQGRQGDVSPFLTTAYRVS
jgi:hypothetical protein